MSFDGSRKNASGLDDQLAFAISGGEAKGESRSGGAALELLSASFVQVTTEPAAREWLAKSRYRDLVGAIADEFARYMSSSSVLLRLETNSDNTDAYLLILAYVSPDSVDASLQKLFAFTSTQWWLAVVGNTRGAIIVDMGFA